MAEIVGVHGIKGIVKVKAFTDDPEGLMDYMPLCDAAGNQKFDFLSLQQHKNIFLVELDGVADRTAAEKLPGTKLYVHRDRLPKIKEDNTYYYRDLIGLAVKDESGTVIGKILQVANFGAGDLLEIKPLKGASYYLPFTNANVPKVDTKTREVTVIIPPGLLD